MKQKYLSGNLEKLKNELEHRLIVMRYSKESTNAYMRIFGWVANYLNGYGESNYSKEFGQKFLVEYPLQAIHTSSQFKNARTVIRRMDEILEDKLFSPCFRKAKMECPLRFIDIQEKYIESLIKRGYTTSTIKYRKRYAGQLLGRLPETILSLEELTAADLYEVFTKYEWASSGLAIAKYFLSFLFESGVIKSNLCVYVPQSCRPRSLPSVYSSSEIERLFASVDRNDSLGKRDYAILVLAAYLGLRSSDIVNLSLKDIDYKAKTIEVTQIKTLRPVTLVMNIEVEEAVADYIKNSRPQSSIDKIFLSSQAPFAPLTAGAGYAVAHKYFNLARIAAQGRKQGTHALRSSYATALISKGVPYAVVTEALGHANQESAKYYVRVDVRRLRICALDVPKPIGSFAVLLEPEIRQNISLYDFEGVLA